MRTLSIMKWLANSRGGKTSMVVRQLALDLVKHLPPKDIRAEVVALHAFVRDRIRYVRDVEGAETVQTPERTLTNAQGDCDDKATLLASLLKSIGIPARFEAVGLAPGRWSHVLVSAMVGGAWVPLETTLDVPAGWFPPRVAERISMRV